MNTKILPLLVAACLGATTAFAQHEAPRTTVKQRDNGTAKITKVNPDGSRVITKTGKTNLGAAADNTKDAAGNLVKKGEKVVKKGAQKVTGTTKKATGKAEQKTE